MAVPLSQSTDDGVWGPEAERRRGGVGVDLRSACEDWKATEASQGFWAGGD